MMLTERCPPILWAIKPSSKDPPSPSLRSGELKNSKFLPTPRLLQSMGLSLAHPDISRFRSQEGGEAGHPQKTAPNGSTELTLDN